MKLFKLPLFTILSSFLSLFSWDCYAQDGIQNFLILGVEAAQDITSDYTAPIAEGLLYGVVGGWYNSAKVKDEWTVDISLVTNGSFIPSEKKFFVLDANKFENLEILGGGIRATVPTILGGNGNTATLIGTLDGEQLEFETPKGIGLLSLNLLPSAFIQVKVAMPKATQVMMRVFPQITIQDDYKIGLIGFGVQHEFSRWIKGLQSSDFALSGLVAFTSLSGEYDIQAQELVSGDNQKIDTQLDSWLFELIGSTTFPVFNVYGGFGFATGTSSTELVGTYVIETQVQTRTFENPFSLGNDVSGIRANVGANVQIGFFSINLDYTFQGYNNISLGLNFTVN